MMMPYSAYKDSKLDWLGKIPSHWDLVKLGACFKERNEKVSDKDFAALSVTKNGILPQMEHVAKTDAGDNRKKVCIGDFVINSRSDRKGSSGTSDYDGSVSLISIILEPRLYEPRFAHHLLRSYNFQEEFYKYGKGIVADLWSTRYSDMKNIFVPLMPIAEQKAIATFLDRETQRIDSLIEEKQTFIKLLKEKRQALISHVVTKGLNPNVEMQDSGIEWIGQVPKHWEVKKIKHICSNFMYGTSQDCNQSEVGYPVLRIPNIKSTNVDFEDLKYANISDADALTYLLSRGDILVIRTNGNPNLVGQSALFDSNGQYLFASYLIKLTPKLGVDTSFLVEAMNSLSVRQALTFQSRTSVGNYNLSIPSLANTNIAIPPIDEQKTITNYLSAATKNIDLLIQETNKSIVLLKEHRTSLISAAVTGKIDVREAV
ncbi:TPA: restriction endonuclease subunit S [Vibrio vulnificus]|nr:restriction endonuclease subunit S [Vibrio vulnificus]